MLILMYLYKNITFIKNHEILFKLNYFAMKLLQIMCHDDL